MQFLTSICSRIFQRCGSSSAWRRAVPYHWGDSGLAQDLKRPPLEELLLRNVYFDTCVYTCGHRAALQGRAARQYSLRSEMVAQCAASIRAPVNTTTTPSATSMRYRERQDRDRLFSGNALRVYPRLGARLAAAGSA